MFEVERHIRGKWTCRRCERLIQAPVAPHIIDKGIPTPGLLAQVLIAKYLDHAPLYRQEQIFGRAGLALPRSTLAQWVGACGVGLQPLADALKVVLLTRAVLHADETPVPMLKPGLGRTHRAYLWSYSSSEYDELPAVVYDFADSRSGQHAREFLGAWSGKLVCDDYSGYKALFARGVTEVGCMAHCPESVFIRRGRGHIGETSDQFVSNAPDNNSHRLRVRQGMREGRASVTMVVRGRERARSAARSAREPPASSADWW